MAGRTSTGLGRYYRTLRAALFPIRKWLMRQYNWLKKIFTDPGRIRQEISQLQAAGQPIKVVVGAGDIRSTGWVHTDLPAMNMFKAEDWQRFFQPGSIQRMMAEHVVEHITPEQFAAFLDMVRVYLTADGRIRIAVPDGNHPDPEYIEYVRPGGSGPGCDDHKVLYTADNMTALLSKAGYDYALLEYYDKNGQFHQTAWDATDGHIHRAFGYHSPGIMHIDYTSLIVDCWSVS